MKVVNLSHMVPAYFCTYNLCPQSSIQIFQGLFSPVLLPLPSFCGLLLLTAHNEDSLEIRHEFLEPLCLKSRKVTSVWALISSKGALSQWLVWGNESPEFPFLGQLRLQGPDLKTPLLGFSLSFTLFPSSLTGFWWGQVLLTQITTTHTLRAQRLNPGSHVWASLPAGKRHSFEGIYLGQFGAPGTWTDSFHLTKVLSKVLALIHSSTSSDWQSLVPCILENLWHCQT